MVCNFCTLKVDFAHTEIRTCRICGTTKRMHAKTKVCISCSAMHNVCVVCGQKENVRDLQTVYEDIQLYDWSNEL